MVCFTLLCDWSSRLQPPSQQIRFKTKTPCNLVTKSLFLSFNQFACFYFEFSFTPGGIFLCADCLLWSLILPQWLQNITLIIVSWIGHWVFNMNKIQKLFFGYQDVPHVFFFTFFFFGCKGYWILTLWRCNAFGNGLNYWNTTTKVFSHEKW